MSKNLGKLTGVEPVKSNTALVVLDMISDFDFEDGDKLFRNAIAMAKDLGALIERARAANVPVLYVNDNFGKWREDFSSYVESVRGGSGRGRDLVDLIGPRPGDYHILKPQRSAFYATPFEVLLLTLNVSELIMTGVTTDICVLFSAHDAYMRGYKLKVPGDCTAAVEQEFHAQALSLMERVVYADTGPGAELTFA